MGIQLSVVLRSPSVLNPYVPSEQVKAVAWLREPTFCNQFRSSENDAKVPAVFFSEAVKAWDIEQHVLPHWRGFQHVLVSN
ncbi:hypothetical protein Bca52824_076578 [Brassica carinata]|uniref:Uncharacterized protein n=1 Tax=Brassica carinata TaxID=52824 RepID=A0A8X7PRW4_BRACI|nr:hypothetical protein Bca52824_076578 [Brassica carinata]